MLLDTQVADNVARLTHIAMGIREEYRDEWCDAIGMAPWLKERVISFCLRFSERTREAA